MYIEISGRRTGKTHRLIESARKSYEEGYIPVIITFDFNQAQLFSREYSDSPFYFIPYHNNHRCPGNVLNTKR